MMSSKDFYDFIKTQRKEKKWSLIKASTAKRMEALGYVDLGIGSFRRWMLKDWFYKALKQEVLKKNVYGQYVPYVKEMIIEEPVGKKGRDYVVEKKKILLFQPVLDFFEEYDKFEDNTQAEQYKLSQIIEDRKDLIKSI